MSIDALSLQHRLATAFAGQLEVGDLLGSGGFASVFRARDPILQRDVAIKVMEASANDADAEARFLEEARIVATVEHPHIVPLYGAELRDGLLCLTMRLIPGRSLAARIADDGPLAPADAARIAHEVAQALVTAHAHGIVHRDIKPENILLDADGHAIVTDFGISLLTGRPSARQAGMMIGTPQYVSPEQALGDAIDGQADVYSLGIVLYEMLSGRLPFVAATTSGILAKQILEAPPSLATLRPDTPSALVRITEQALAKSPTARPTAAVLTDLLAAARAPDQLRTPRMVRRARRWRRIRWVTAMLVISIAILTFAGWSVYETYTMLSGGEVPALSAMSASIPETLTRAALIDGSLHDGERIAYAFVPHGKTIADALLLTDSAVVRRTASGRSRRYPAWQAGSSLSMTAYRDGGARGLVMQTTGARPAVDTLYSALSGIEVGTLISAFVEIARQHDQPSAGTRR